MTYAEVYLTEEDALKLMFPKSERIRKDSSEAKLGEEAAD